MSRNAELTRYELTTDIPAPNSDGFIAGYLEFDSARLRPNASLRIEDVHDFAFTWGSDVFWSKAERDVFWNNFTFELDPAMNVLAYDLCVSSTADHLGDRPIFRVLSGSFAGAALDIDVRKDGNPANTGWERRVSVSVPKPGALAQLGQGITEIGLNRWREKLTS